MQQMKLVVPQGYRWIETETRNDNGTPVKGCNYDYFNDVISFYIPCSVSDKSLNHRSLDYMNKRFN